MEENKKFICIRCPRGCEIATTLDGYSITHIEGNVCRLGEEYVKSEISDPRRALTSTVKVKKREVSISAGVVECAYSERQNPRCDEAYSRSGN